MPGSEKARFAIGTREAFTFRARWTDEQWAQWLAFLDEVRQHQTAAVLPDEIRRVLPVF